MIQCIGYSQAYSLIEDMKAKIANVNVAYYINLDTVRAIEQAVGVQLIGEYINNVKSGFSRMHFWKVGPFFQEHILDDFYLPILPQESDICIFAQCRQWLSPITITITKIQEFAFVYHKHKPQSQQQSQCNFINKRFGILAVTWHWQLHNWNFL